METSKGKPTMETQLKKRKRKGGKTPKKSVSQISGSVEKKSRQVSIETQSSKNSGQAAKGHARKQEKTVGPAFSPRTVINDEWQTCKESWQDIAHLFAKYKKSTVWQPFFYDGKCAVYLKEIGFKKVLHSNQDFFVKVRDQRFTRSVDLIWDNPPYTSPETKEKVLIALAKLGKPFVMLLPMTVLHVKFVRDVLDMSKVQCIIPRRVLVRKSGKTQVPFKYLCWLCYNVNLPRDMYFI